MGLKYEKERKQLGQRWVNGQRLTGAKGDIAQSNKEEEQHVNGKVHNLKGKKAGRLWPQNLLMPPAPFPPKYLGVGKQRKR